MTPNKPRETDPKKIRDTKQCGLYTAKDCADYNKLLNMIDSCDASDEVKKILTMQTNRR